jgi:hypothetical protein
MLGQYHVSIGLGAEVGAALVSLSDYPGAANRCVQCSVNRFLFSGNEIFDSAEVGVFGGALRDP